MYVVARLKKRALKVETDNLLDWHKNWPDWALAEVRIKDINHIEAFVERGGCYVVEGHGYMSTHDFNNRFMEIE